MLYGIIDHVSHFRIINFIRRTRIEVATEGSHYKLTDHGVSHDCYLISTLPINKTSFSKTAKILKMSAENSDKQKSMAFKSDKLQYTSSGTPYLTLPPTFHAPIYITPYYTTDTTALQKIMSNDCVVDNLFSPPKPYTLADAEFWVNRQLSTGPDANVGIQVLRAFSPDADGQMIGDVSLTPVASRKSGHLAVIGGEENEYEVGYFLDPQWTGKGIASTAVRMVLEWAKEENTDAQFIIRIAVGNVPSRKLVERMPEWELIAARVGQETWAENKGGETKQLDLWKWRC
jgi:RimJ/RimL family protein N-acetyltransferase